MTNLRRLKNSEVTTAISVHAQAILNAHRHEPFGTEVPFQTGGVNYVGVIEKHYHAPGGKLTPWGEHPGCSVFVVEADAVHGDGEPLVQRYHFGRQSLRVLGTVDPRLQATMKRAIEITQVDFSIVCGHRTQAEQRALFQAGKTATMNSRHLTGHAVDVAPFVGGKIVWDWPNFNKLAPFIMKAADDVGCPIQWGGNWRAPTQPDGPHWQIPWGL